MGQPERGHGDHRMTTQETLDYLADRDILISIAYGYADGKGKCFSVDIYNQASEESLPMPERANSYEHAVEIAYLEAVRLEWVEPKA